MDVLRITPRGFCHGVVDAIRLAQEAGQTHAGPVYMLGYLVHNAHVVQELAQYNVQLIDLDDRFEGLEKIEGGTVILTAHGVSPAVKSRAMDRGLTVIDATCSDVYVTHDLIIDLVAKGYEIIYVGMPGHPEPEGAIGEAPDHVHLVSSTDDVAKLDLEAEYIAVTTQTTLSVWDTEDIIASVLTDTPAPRCTTTSVWPPRTARKRQSRLPTNAIWCWWWGASEAPTRDAWSRWCVISKASPRTSWTRSARSIWSGSWIPNAWG